jgi:hypothetical protein
MNIFMNHGKEGAIQIAGILILNTQNWILNGVFDYVNHLGNKTMDNASKVKPLMLKKKG